MNKVYVVIKWSNTYSTFHIVKIFDSLYKAESFKKDVDRDNSLTIETFKLE